MVRDIISEVAIVLFFITRGWQPSLKQIATTDGCSDNFVYEDHLFRSTVLLHILTFIFARTAD